MTGSNKIANITNIPSIFNKAYVMLEVFFYAFLKQYFDFKKKYSFIILTLFLKFAAEKGSKIQHILTK